MSLLKKVYNQMNIVGQAKRYGISIWRHPQFLFILMGLIILITSSGFYLIGTRYLTNPLTVALIDIAITAVLFIISFVVTNSFESLAEASRMKSEFINIISHQLRTPATNIKWITDFLTTEDIEMSKEKKVEYFSSLRENIKQMMDLIDELLIVSRIEQGSLPVHLKEASLINLVKEIISNSKVSAKAKGILLKFSYPKDLPDILLDLNLSKMTISNLIDNAIHYTRDKGKINIKIEKEKNRVYFSIVDTGVGIPEKDQKHIFKKFFRSENAMREQTRGSGLGLYIAKSAIERQRGKLWFTSVEGKGTTFRFFLPM